MRGNIENLADNACCQVSGFGRGGEQSSDAPVFGVIISYSRAKILVSGDDRRNERRRKNPSRGKCDVEFLQSTSVRSRHLHVSYAPIEILISFGDFRVRNS